MDKSLKHKISLSNSVKERKDYSLKQRLKTLIQNRGMSEPDFFNKLQLSRQLWYYYSWGLWECPIHIKLKIARELETDSCLIWQDKREDDRQNS